MAEMQVSSDVQTASIEAVVIRCKCGNAAKVHPETVCPIGERVNLGTVAYYSRSPLKTAYFKILRALFELAHRELYR